VNCDKCGKSTFGNLVLCEPCARWADELKVIWIFVAFFAGAFTGIGLVYLFGGAR
jgi:hypothetical protein